MRRQPLRIEEPPLRSVRGRHEVDEGHERDLRGVSPVVKHRLGGKESTDRDAVNASREAVVVPGLDRMCPPELVQARVCAYQRLIEPGTGSRWVGTSPDHVSEGSIDADLEPALCSPEASGDPEAVEGDDRARCGRPPRQAAVVTWHREEPDAVGGKQRSRLEVGASRHRVVGVVVAGGREGPCRGGRFRRHSSECALSGC